MENRVPGAGDAAVRVGPHRLRWLLLAAAVLVILLILVTAARQSGSALSDPWMHRGAGTVGQSAPVTQASVAATTPAEAAREPARIVDERAEDTDPDLRRNPLSRLQAGTESAALPQQLATSGEAAGPATAASRPRPPARSATASAPGAAADARSGNDLLSTLLGIIRQEEPDTVATSPMGELISQVLAENERTYNETSAALASLGQPQAEQPSSTPARPSRAQRALQACPAANTVQGINCRDRVCARWAGRDPACPAR